MRKDFRPPETRPPDFETFWEKTQQELAGVSADVQRQALPEAQKAHRQLEHLSFRSLGGTWIRAYSLKWQDGESRPLVVHSHGYQSECRPRWDWSNKGVNVLGVDIRGFGQSFEALPLRSRWGYVLTGISSPETSVLRGAVCDYVRAVEVALSDLATRTTRVVLHGVSFAGGLAWMSEALMNVAHLLVAGVPTFGWAEGRNFFVKSGSGAEIRHYLDERPESAEDTMLVLRYFDPLNFSSMIKAPTLVGVGLVDDVVPAKTVYPVVNHLTAPFEVMEFPVSHTELPEEAEWKRFEDRWLDLALHGVPEYFGKAQARPVADIDAVQ